MKCNAHSTRRRRPGGDIGLRGHGMRDCDGHGGRVFEEGSQKARRRELKREIEARAVAALAGNTFAIVIVEVELAR